MTRSAPNSIATIDQFINTVGSVKTASEKAADGSTPLSEPGSIGGETTHPVKKVDDRLEKAKEGERSAENSKDVKKDQGAPSVENAAEASTKNAAANIFGTIGRFAKKADGAVSTPGSAEDDHLAVTTKVAPTGEDPAHETNSAKAGKEDKKQGNMGGTKHPASTENDSLDGHKYAADNTLEKMAADMRTIGNDLLAVIHGVYQNGGVEPPQQTKTAAANAPARQQTIDPNLAYHVGNELAGLINGTFDKQSADKLVHDTLVGVVKQASDDADAFIHYAQSFQKAAEGEEGASEDPGAGGAGGPPAGMEGGGAEGGGAGDEGAMMSALGGGAGGDPSGGGAPPGGGGGGGDEAQQLAQILESLGVTSEQLEQALQQHGMGGGAEGGGAPPGGGGDPMGGMGGAGGGDPMGAMGGGGGGAAPPPGGMETQASVGGGKRAANHAIKQADVKNYIVEIMNRSRGRK